MSKKSIHEFTNDVVVVGGCGHVGLPLAIAFADANLSVVALDINPVSVAMVNNAKLPFREVGAQEKLNLAVSTGKLRATTSRDLVSTAEFVVVVIGTPVDEHLAPNPEAIIAAFEGLKDYIVEGQTIILRSTVYPGVTKRIDGWLASNHLKVHLAFCPERIAEGKAMTELYSLPQIIGARDAESQDKATNLFARLGEQFVYVSPEEAELAKLFTNVWRYIKFAAVNQFYMMANDFGVDFEQIRYAITFEYPRAADMPAAGFAAGPCLFKDTMQLGAFSHNGFALGHAAMLVNEGLPGYVVKRINSQYPLEKLTVGILGMAFKAEVDDPRSSLSYKLRKQLLFKAKEVLISDPYVNDDRLITAEELIKRSDVIVIGTPHEIYRNLVIEKPLFDIWNIHSKGVLF
jgi:UDP-N-acetyl-D-mannosaminuronic acid dehydrogenase